MEFHLLANHLFSNAKALIFAGLFFEDLEADGWLRKGCLILEKELGEQILDDGGHFELSPMYHALALEDVLDLTNLLQTFRDALPRQSIDLSENLKASVHPMQNWLRIMTHPDGDVSFFNDTAIGIAPHGRELRQYANRLGFASAENAQPLLTRLPSSGYVRVEEGECVAIIDVAAIGPDYMPGHGHADTLSFELSVFGHRIFVNSGVSEYGVAPERLRQRGTSAHNTVVVDGRDSSEVWSGFRVARRARPIKLNLTTDNGTEIRCAHDGYHRLGGSPTHYRRWRFSTGLLRITDRVTGRFSSAEARFHIHPDVAVIAPPSMDCSASPISLVLPSGRTIRMTVRGGEVRTEETTWHPSFGVSIPNTCICAKFDGPMVEILVEWDGLT